MKNFVLLGHPLGHSLSPFINSELFKYNGIDAKYSLYDCPQEKLPTVKQELCDMAGANVTIPYKQAIIPLLDAIEGDAKIYKSVNVVKNHCNKLIGYNTDIFGFEKSLQKLGFGDDFPQTCLVMGAGGVGKAFAARLLSGGSNVTVAVREVDKYKKELTSYLSDFSNNTADIVSFENIDGDFDLLVNATPVGMYPKADKCPLSKEGVSHCKAVFDAIYNPQETLLLQYAKQLGLPYLGGMDMLVWQAAKANQIWYDAKIDDDFIENLIQRCYRQMQATFLKKLYLTGFMASGKSYYAKLLHEQLNLPLYDTDAIIESKYGKITDIFKEKGESYFRSLERETLASLPDEPCIVSCGGGTLIAEENVALAKSNGKILFVDTPLSVCLERMDKSNNRPLASDAQSLYALRLPLYQEIADMSICGTSGAETVIKTAKNMLCL